MAILEIEGRRVEVDDSFKDLSPEQQAATVDEIAKSMNIKPSGGISANSFLGQVNAGIADTIGGMVDFVNPLDNLGVTGSAKTGLRNLMQAGNAAVATDAPETFVQSLGRGVGEAAGAFGPMAKGAQLATRIPGAVGMAADDVARALTTTGGFAAETAAGGISRAAGDTAERAGYGPIVQGVASVAAPVAAFGAVQAAKGLGNAAMKVSPAAALVRGVKSATMPFTEKGARVIVEDALKAATADPDRAVARLDAENLGRLTPAQQTGEPGLMALERGYADRSAAVAEELANRARASRETLGAAAKEGAQGRTARDTRQFFEDRAATHLKFLENLKSRAEKQADEALRKAETTSNPMAMSASVKQKIDSAYEAASKREAALWSKVPKKVEIQTAQARQAYLDALEETTDVSADSIPAKAAKFLGEDGFGETVSMDRLHRLYSEMRRVAREANAQVVPDEFRARQANRIADAILKDIEATDPQGVSRLLEDARAYSKSMNEVFNANAVASATAVKRSGADRIPESLVLDQTIGAGGRRGAQAVDEIRGAVGSQADMEMQEFLKADFVNKGVRGGTLDPARADTFIRNNADLLARFPDGLEPVIRQAAAAASKADRRGEQLDAAVKYLGDRNAEGPIGFINAKVGQEVASSIFSAKNPAAAARALARAAQKDANGDAYLGLKGGVFDEVIKRASTGGTLRGDRLAEELNNPETRKVLREILSPQELSRLRVVATQLKKVDDWEAVAPDALQNAPNQLVATFLQLQAAKAGRAMGTGTIQAPGIMVSRVRNLWSRLALDKADSLLFDAIRDPKLMQALLMGPGSSKAAKEKAGQTLTNWLIGAGAANVPEEREWGGIRFRQNIETGEWDAIGPAN